MSVLLGDTGTVYNVTMTNANTEYSQALPENTRILEFRIQDITSDCRFSYQPGKVATPTAPYRNLFAGEVKTIEGINLREKTLYFASSVAGAKIEIECWT